MTTGSRLTATEMIFYGDVDTDINAKMTATNDILTLAGNSGDPILLRNLALPLTSNDAVTKQYVDNLVVAGVTWKNAANAATTAGSMTDSTYSNAGLGTITWATNPGTIDGVTMVLNYRVVVQNEAATNGTNSTGIYQVTNITGTLILTRATDAAEGSQANGAAIFVFAGTANGDKAFVVTNDALVNWDAGVIFSVMSSVPAVVIGGTDTQVQYNNSGVLGANASYTFNKSTTTPVLGLGGAATGLTTLNMGTSTFASTIAGVGSGLMTMSGAGAVAVTGATTATVTATSGAATFQASSGAVAVTGSTSASMTGGTSTAVTATTGAATLQASSGAVAVTGTTSASMTGGTSTTVTATTGAATLQASSGAVAVTGTTSASMTGGTGVILTATTGNASISGSGGVNVYSSAGTVTIGAGSSTASNTVNISTFTPSTATQPGGEIDITAGSGNTTGDGGALDFNAGAGGDTGAGGAVTIDAGLGGATSGLGGHVIIKAGSATAVADAGNVVLKIAKNDTSTSTNNIIQFQNGAGTAIGRITNAGDMYATSFNATSDIRYKTNIEHLGDPLNTLKKIEGYSYNWKKDFSGYSDALQYGVLAQQLETAGLHHLVAGSEESKAVNYTGLIPLLIEAVKELSAKVEKYETPRKVGRPRKTQ